MGISLHHDIIVSIVQDYRNDTETLRSLSLVSHSFCVIAQSTLFSKMTLSYDEEAQNKIHGLSYNDVSPFKWPKLEFLARSDKILRYIRKLAVLLSGDHSYPGTALDAYWHEVGSRGRRVLDALDRWLPSCLDRMSSLDTMTYVGPSLRGPVHQAILCHGTLRCLKTFSKTRCLVPCKEALRKTLVGDTAISELEIMESGHEMDSFGFLGMGMATSSIGPRSCAFLSQMVSTHSASLKILRIPLFLLYDALIPLSSLPDFLCLSSLYIEDPTGCPLTRMGLYSKMSALALSFIIHTHKSLITLH
ncbi:hypothetical protein FRC14_005748 [Serendipita sp. 396]|nr:hypothetical protein FRC14_005748 [Serendipita sp. 396]KAG8783314.1 hypothetical protein FRC15_005420 [Serendipita sp. 397]KAG8799173.1 hypothetical protein FRC16_005653 [Serendipita sp. 398]KAG8865598.1 hypothetical protein FRC20_009645 [Serendipita sp. 405]